MVILVIICIALSGGILFRVKGSGDQWGLSPVNKWLFSIWYGVLCIGFSHGVMWARIVFGLLGFGAMKLSYIPGHDLGPFVGQPAKAKINFLDFIDPNRFADKPLLRCAYRYAILGAFGGILVSAATMTFIPMLNIIAMPLGYYFGAYWLCYRWKLISDPFKASEYPYGALWLLIATIPVLF